jgi:general secretion pathway protein G
MKKIKSMLVLALPLMLFGVGASSSPDECRISAVRATQGALKTALDLYQVDTGSYPTEAQGLGVLITNPGIANWHGPYIWAKDGKLPPDPWGHAFRYQLTNGIPIIDSPGPDGAFGTPDDNGKNIERSTRTTGCTRF